MGLVSREVQVLGDRPGAPYTVGKIALSLTFTADCTDFAQAAHMLDPQEALGSNH